MFVLHTDPQNTHVDRSAVDLTHLLWQSPFRMMLNFTSNDETKFFLLQLDDCQVLHAFWHYVVFPVAIGTHFIGTRFKFDNLAPSCL